MKRLDHLSMIVHDVGRISRFLGFVSLVPFAVLVIFQEWDMLLPMASAPLVFLVLGTAHPGAGPGLRAARFDNAGRSRGRLVLNRRNRGASLCLRAGDVLYRQPFRSHVRLDKHRLYHDPVARPGTHDTPFLADVHAMDWRYRHHCVWDLHAQEDAGDAFPDLPVRGKTRRSHAKPQVHGWKMWKIYIFLTCLFTGLVMLAGIPLWDALNLVMVAIATGGFTLHSAGLAYYNNPLLEVLLLPVMFAGAIPFKLYFLMYRGKIDAMFRDKTIRLLLLVALAGSAIVSLELYLFNGLNPLTALREGVFVSVAGLCTCGLQNADIHVWAAIPLAVISLLVFIGGAMGSMARGIKINRMALAYRGGKVVVPAVLCEQPGYRAIPVQGRMLSREMSEMEISKNMLVIALYIFYGIYCDHSLPAPVHHHVPPRRGALRVHFRAFQLRHNGRVYHCDEPGGYQMDLHRPDVAGKA